MDTGTGKSQGGGIRGISLWAGAAACWLLVPGVRAEIHSSQTLEWGLQMPEPIRGSGGGFGVLPGSGLEYANFRLVMHVSGDDDFLVAEVEMFLDPGVHFYYNPLGADNPPNPALFDLEPDVEYDTYFTTGADYPNRPYRGGVVQSAGTPTLESNYIFFTWFDTEDTGDGDFYVASVTFVQDVPGVWP